MNSIDITSNKPYSSGWHLYGELELPASANARSLLQTWLVETLHPLSLNASFLEKIFTSSRLSVDRTLQSPVGKQSKHIHILIFASVHQPLPGNTWGFFVIEKIENTSNENHIPAHAIEFYLYQEGKG